MAPVLPNLKERRLRCVAVFAQLSDKQCGLTVSTLRLVVVIVDQNVGTERIMKQCDVTFWPEPAVRCAAVIRQQLGVSGTARCMLETTQLTCSTLSCSPNEARPSRCSTNAVGLRRGRVTPDTCTLVTLRDVRAQPFRQLLNEARSLTVAIGPVYTGRSVIDCRRYARPLCLRHHSRMPMSED